MQKIKIYARNKHTGRVAHLNYVVKENKFIWKKENQRSITRMSNDKFHEDFEIIYPN